MRKPIKLVGPYRAQKAVRSTAAVLGVTLVFASVVPPLALAETDSEGEGTGAPAPILGLEIGRGHEPAGAETTLEEVPAEAGEEEVEEAGVDIEEVEPAFEDPPPTAAPEELTTPPATAATEPAPGPVEAVPAPAYGTEESAPAYKAEATSPPVEAVRNEAIIAPAVAGQAPVKSKPKSVKAEASGPIVSPTPEPEPAPAPVATAAPLAVSVPVDRPGSLSGKRTHVVAAGECLWSIAAARLPVGASDAQIAAEVARLWRLNEGRIGTGDPSILPVGVVLKLG